MKKILYFVFISALITAVFSCTLDNYDLPEETLRGTVVDVVTGDPVLTDQGSEGIRVRIRELSWEKSAPENFDIYCMKEGLFQNTKVFKGYYNVRVDGPFIPIVRVDTEGDTLFDGSKNIEIKGLTEIEFKVQPFLKIEWVGKPVVKNGKVTATIKVTRGVSPQAFKSKIKPMGNYNDDMLNVTDVRLFVSQVPYVGFRQWDNRYSTQIRYENNSFEALLGQPITITTQGIITPGRTVFIRAAARINYATEGIKRYNYNKALMVKIPEK